MQDGKNREVAGLLASRKLSRGNRLERSRSVIPSGLPALDLFLPFSGFEKGGITELVGDGPKHLISCFTMACHSRNSRVAYLAADGLLNPVMLQSLGGHLDNIYFLIEAEPAKLFWAVQQLLSSGLFALVVLYGSRWSDKSPLGLPVSYRRLRGLTKKHHLTLLLLLDEHNSLPFIARPCSLRLRVKERITITKCGGAGPGGSMPLPESWPAEERYSGAAIYEPPLTNRKQR